MVCSGAMKVGEKMKARLKAHVPALIPVVRFGKMMAWRMLPMRHRFQQLYRYENWGDPGQSTSGSGSTQEQTQAIRAQLPQLLHELGVRSLLDAPCGDFYWMKGVDLGGIDYIGADIVPAVIEANRRRYGESPNRRFVTLDITRDSLPRADLLLCRDCLVHLSNRCVLKALANICRGGSTHLLATTFPSHPRNHDIVTGSWRALNLEAPPFRLPQPLLTINENCPEPGFTDKSLGLWRIADLSVKPPA